MIYVPAIGTESWRLLLAEPERHWKQTFSAWEIAHSWQQARGFPPSVRLVLDQAEVFRALEPLLIIPEHQVPLPGGARPTQTDVWVLARTPRELVSIAVEGKVAEEFGPTVGQWVADASVGKEERLAFLAQRLGLPAAVPTELRYQLLHRTAAALIEAERFHAKHAVMLVHSFSPDHAWLDDHRAFARALGTEGDRGKISRVGQRNNVELYVGWVEDRAGAGSPVAAG